MRDELDIITDKVRALVAVDDDWMQILNLEHGLLIAREQAEGVESGRDGGERLLAEGPARTVELPCVPTRTTCGGRMTEKEMQDIILEAAAWGGWLAHHVYDARRSTGEGFPDLIMLRAGEMLAWELKSDTGRVSDDQQKWIDEFAKVPGCEAEVIWPKDLDRASRRLMTRKP